MRLIALLIMLSSCISVFAQQPKAKLPVEEEQKAALVVIGDVYKSDYEKAKTAAQKVELAKKLLNEGAATKDDPISRFVLFRVARDIAAKQGDLTTAFDAIGRIETEYEVDALPMKIEAATLVVKALKTPKDHQACAASLGTLIGEAIALDRYDHAKSLVALALGCAREGREADQIKLLVAKTKEIEELAAEFDKMKDAKALLDSKPTDPAANLAVGKFLCLVKGDWKRGVTMLALGDNDELKAAALLELEAQPDSLKLGDAWWKIAEGLEGSAKSRAQTHAGEWYRKALPGLSGLTKARVERLIAQVAVSEPNVQRMNTAKTTDDPSKSADANVKSKPKKPESFNFSFATEKEIKDYWTLPSDDGDWQIINGALQLHGNKTKYFQSNFQIVGDCEILVTCSNKGWGGPSIHLFGEKLELPGPDNGGPMSYKVHIVRKGGELVAKANDKQYRFQIKDAIKDKSSRLGFSYTNHNNSGIRISGLAIMADELKK
jgi:hypothetical protein